jgi:hypothetical protein
MALVRSGTGPLFDKFTSLAGRINRRKSAEDAGKTVYVCARYENSKGEAGNWGPLASAVVT